MKGLIRNNLYSMASNIRTSLILAGFFVLFPLGLQDVKFISIIMAVQIFLFVTHTGASLRVDETSKWSKFELTLPVRRRTIIGAKYVSFIVLILCGTIMSLLTLAVAYIAGVPLESQSVIYSLGFGLTLAITSVAVMYPVMLKMGAEKSELIFSLSVPSSIGIMLVLAALLAPMTGGMQMKHPLVATVSACTAAVLFVVSYLVSIRFHRNKEFK